METMRRKIWWNNIRVTHQILLITLLFVGKQFHLTEAGYGYNNNDDINNYADNYGGGNDDDYKRVNDDYDQYNDDNSSGGKSTNIKFSYKGEAGFNAVSIMPVSCLNYNSGHMIKFELFENNSSYQCHFKNLGTYVVSVAHYMRAYFNYQYVVNGDDFELPDDAGYLTCVVLDETSNTGNPLYAKIGCQEKETLVSTRLQLYLYEDEACSVPYSNGYYVNGYTISSKISFRPPFYTCSTCTPEQISDSFTKDSKSWYDDDIINGGGVNQVPDDQYDDDDGYDDNKAIDDIWKVDDQSNANVDYGYFKADDDGNRRLLDVVEDRYSEKPRTLHESNQNILGDARFLVSRGVGNWNMCDRLWRYGDTCDSDCLALDAFRADQWTSSDIFLLVVMCLFMASMMLLVLAKRVKAYERATIYGDEDAPYPGLPPMAMFLLFVLVLTVILVLANLKMVNETLLFAVITCIFLFMYMLKLTLFESRGPMLLPAARHRSGNSMSRQLFE